MNPSLKNTLREEFEKKFILTKVGIIEGRPSHLGSIYHDDFNAVSNWWLSRFDTILSDMKERIEQQKWKNPWNIQNPKYEKQLEEVKNYNKGINAALQVIKKLL